jgi:methylase of polypeptide subunit release factors
VSYRGQIIRVCPGVLSPRYDWSGKFGVDCLPQIAGKTFLEIGSGCGIVSVFASLLGAKTVVAVDISPFAVANTRFNFIAHQLSNAYVVRGDLFDSISAKFDLVFFNAPFHGDAPLDWLARSVSDEQYRSLKRFLLGVRRYLAKDGRVLLGFSESGDQDLLHAGFVSAGLSVVEVREARKRGYSCKYYTLKPTHDG